jgi:hypothetical protein
MIRIKLICTIFFLFLGTFTFILPVNSNEYLNLSLPAIELVQEAVSYKVGPKRCSRCHINETKVWEGTKKFAAFKKIHKNKRTRKFIDSISAKHIKKSPICIMCHYTGVQRPFREKEVIVHGASCESCHGPASVWIEIHNDYGIGKSRETETKEHKFARIQSMDDAGMIRGGMHYDIAQNCMSCHGLASPNLPVKIAEKLFSSGHPLNPSFEIVEYSQGRLLHRFYPPDQTVNKKLTPAELSRLYAVGQAASLVAATAAIKNATDALYIAEQNKRISTATSALTSIQGLIVEARSLLISPTETNARAFINALADKDLTSIYSEILPKTYK